MNSGDRVRKASALFGRIGRWLVTALFAMLVLVVSLQVVNRYLAKTLGLMAWTQEMALFLLIWVTFLGAIWVTRDDEHIALKSLVQLLPRRGQVIASLVTDLIAAALLVILVREGIAAMRLNLNVVTPVLGLSRTVSYAALGFASLCMLIHTGIHFFQNLRLLLRVE